MSVFQTVHEEFFFLARETLEADHTDTTPNEETSSSLLQPSEAPPEAADPEKVLTLVRADDITNKIRLSDACIERFRKGQESVVLSLKSHPGMALGYFPSSKSNLGDVRWYVPGLVKQEDEANCTKWRYIDDTWISATMHKEYENQPVCECDLEIYWWKIEERRKMCIIYDAYVRERKLIVDNNGGRAFQINYADGSISPRDDPTLFLGTRGNRVTEENLIDAIYLRCGIDLVREIASRADNINALNSGKSALTAAVEVCDMDTVTMLLQEFDASTDIEDQDTSPLGTAAHFGHQDIVKVLLENGANRNTVNRRGNTPLSLATLGGHLNCVNVLLNDPETDVDGGRYPAIGWATQINYYRLVERLLDNGASLDVVNQDGQYPIQQACSKSLPLAKILVRHRGDLSPEKILEIRGRAKRNEAEKIFVEAYADLTVKEISRCGVRSYLRGKFSRNAVDINEWNQYNPFLHCLKLVECAREKYFKLRKSDVTAADSYNKLFIKLQLVSACILNEINTNTTEIARDGNKIITATKDKNLMLFLTEDASIEALAIAHTTQSRLLFSQPVLFDYFARIWYGEAMYEIFVECNSPNMLVFFWQVLVIVILFIIQTPILPFLGYIPRTVLSKLERIELPEFIAKSLHLKTKQLFIVLEPLSLFLLQCITDLAFAIIFTMIDGDYIITSARSVPLLLLAFAVTSTLIVEIRDFYIGRNSKAYFLVDRFNIFDLPGLVIATLSLLLPLIFENRVDIFLVKVLLSFSNVFLWLRLLRFLTLYAGTAHLTIIFFNMFGRMITWSALLAVIVLAFATGVEKLNLVGDDTCPYISTFSPFELFEDAIAPSNDFFDCTEGDFNGRGYSASATVLIYFFVLIANVLMINMLIAMMTESFASVWDARESNFIFQRVTHCLEMQGKRYLPIQVLYLPYGIYESATWSIKIIGNILNQSRSGAQSSNRTDFQSLTNKTKKYSPFDKKEEDRLVTIFEDYISMRQDEASEEDYWRITLAKKTTRVEKGLDSQRVEIKQELESLKKGVKQEIESVKQEMESLKQDMDSVKQMLRVLIKDKT